MFGAIEFHSGKFIFMETPEKFNSDSYLQFLRHLLDSSSAPIILIEDGAPYHRSSQVKEFQQDMKARGVLFTCRLPSFSPDFNPIEKLWRDTKKDATHLKYFKTFDELRKSVLGAFGKYMSDVTKVIRVMKKLRSLAELQLFIATVKKTLSLNKLIIQRPLDSSGIAYVPFIEFTYSVSSKQSSYPCAYLLLAAFFLDFCEFFKL